MKVIDSEGYRRFPVAFYANRGLLYSKDFPSGVETGLPRDEWQASYKENQIRANNGWPIREYYMIEADTDGNIRGGAGPRLLDDNNKPIKLHWVPLKW